jgi:hypothetical protein
VLFDGIDKNPDLVDRISKGRKSRAVIPQAAQKVVDPPRQVNVVIGRAAAIRICFDAAVRLEERVGEGAFAVEMVEHALTEPRQVFAKLSEPRLGLAGQFPQPKRRLANFLDQLLVLLLPDPDEPCEWLLCGALFSGVHDGALRIRSQKSERLSGIIRESGGTL